MDITGRENGKPVQLYPNGQEEINDITEIKSTRAAECICDQILVRIIFKKEWKKIKTNAQSVQKEY